MIPPYANGDAAAHAARGASEWRPFAVRREERSRHEPAVCFPNLRVKPAQHRPHEIVADLGHPRRSPSAAISATTTPRSSTLPVVVHLMRTSPSWLRPQPAATRPARPAASNDCPRVVVWRCRNEVGHTSSGTTNAGERMLASKPFLLGCRDLRVLVLIDEQPAQPRDGRTRSLAPPAPRPELLLNMRRYAARLFTGEIAGSMRVRVSLTTRHTDGWARADAVSLWPCTCGTDATRKPAP